ncbi:DUF6282 family protein [Chloroflexota bacterium]
MSLIEKLLQGSIDMHIHHGPDSKSERRVDALQAALQAQEAGMRAIVLKSHDYPTTPLAYTVSQMVQGITIVGSVCLNFEVGGLNPHALEASAKLGAKVVWMPTLSSANDVRKNGLTGEGITIVDEEGKLLPVMNEILDIIKSYEMVMATGHVSVSEAFTLVDEARRKGLPKIVVTHPLLESVGAYLNLGEQRQMVEMGAFIEHTFYVTMPLSSSRNPMELVEAIRAVGAEHCVLSTDFGQAWNPAPAEGMRMMIATMLKCGLDEREMELLVKINPAKLLDLD